WLQLGDALMALSKPQEAIDVYHSAVLLRPEVGDAWVCWADALLRSGREAEAEKALRSGLNAAPHSPELCFALGFLLQKTGREAEAATGLDGAAKLGLKVDAAAQGGSNGAATDRPAR